MSNHWHQMTWEEIGALVSSGVDGALLPVGATEQHGPHLGCGMDTEIVDRLCHDVAERTSVALLPTLPYGCSLGHSKRWPGTLALQPKTLIDLIKDIGDWLYASGIRRFFILNGHVTNVAPLRCALEMLRAQYDDLMVALLNTATLTSEIRSRHFADANDWHANAAETALMMAAAPRMVRPSRIAEADDPDRTEGCIFAHPVNRTSSNGVTGYPSRATRADGEELYALMVEALCDKLERGMAERPPLANSYFKSVLPILEN